MKYQNLMRLTIGIAATLWLGGCAAQKAEEIKIVIPGPPEQPRVAYLASYRGGGDFTETKVLDSLIGESSSPMAANMAKPYGVAAKNGIIYATDTIMGVVFVMDPVMKKIRFIGDKSNGKLALPTGVAIDSKGQVYVSDAKLKQVYRYDENGTFLSNFGMNNEFQRPTGIAVNSDLGLLYVVDTLGHNVHMYSLDGRAVAAFGKRGIEDGEFNYPTNIAIDRRNGNVVIGDTQNFRIQIFDKNGKFLAKFGQVGDKPGMFARPKGVAVDSEGHIYAADAAFSNIQVFNDKGELMLYFGSAGNGPATFQLLSALYFDEEDRLYTTEGFNARVQVFQYFSDAWKKSHPVEYKKLIEP